MYVDREEHLNRRKRENAQDRERDATEQQRETEYF